jgi:hypothetical protein
MIGKVVLSLFFFVQNIRGLSLGNGLPIPLNNGFPDLADNPVFIFACCILHQASLDGCDETYCSGAGGKVTAMNTALEHPRNGDAALEVKREMRGLLKHPRRPGGGLLEMRERFHALKAKNSKQRHQHDKHDKNPYTNALWDDGHVYLELDGDLFTKYVAGDDKAVWLMTWVLKVISEYEGHTCLKIYLLPPVSFLQPFIGVLGFLLPRRVIIHMHPQDEAWTEGLGTDAGAVHWSEVEERRGVEHEIGHILGMDHTQIRSDRDTYITYDGVACAASYTAGCGIAFGAAGSLRDSAAQTTENCVAGWVAQYTKDDTLSVVGVDVYNYGSIMHYPFDACMTAKADKLAEFAARAGPPPSVPYVNNITPLDYEQLNTMYHCTAPEENPLISLGRTIFDTVVNAIPH